MTQVVVYQSPCRALSDDRPLQVDSRFALSFRHER